MSIFGLNLNHTRIETSNDEKVPCLKAKSFILYIDFCDDTNIILINDAIESIIDEISNACDQKLL